MGRVKGDTVDPATIFAVDHWGDPAWGINRGDSMAIACNYLDMTDNLLDPSHVAWVHQSSFSNAATEETPLETTLGDKDVTVWRWMIDVEPAPFYAPYLKFKGNSDRQQHYEVHYPSHAIIRAIFAPANTGGEGMVLPEGTILMDSCNFMTPADENTTKYYWFQMRNFAPNDAWVSAEFAKSVRGAFVLDEGSDRPVVLLSGVVGLTPMVAMLHALAAHSDSRALLQGLLCLDDHDFYLCGPPPFMQAVCRTLRSLGVTRERVAYEFCGPATVPDDIDQPAPAVAPPAPVSAPATGAITVEFRKSGIRAEWQPGGKSLLTLAESQGLKPDFSCRAGICGTCTSRIVSGEVSYFEEPLEELAPGDVLLCCSRPTAAIVLDL